MRVKRDKENGKTLQLKGEFCVLRKVITTSSLGPCCRVVC